MVSRRKEVGQQVTRLFPNVWLGSKKREEGSRGPGLPLLAPAEASGSLSPASAGAHNKP